MRRLSRRLKKPAKPRAPAYEFTTTWAAPHETAWRALINELKPRHVLEVGCYEGRTSALVIDAATRHTDLRLTCVDTWAGGVDLDAAAMAGVEERFSRNVTIAIEAAAKRKKLVSLRVIKQPSAVALAALLAQQEQAGEIFDLIYIDGSHTAPDVLADAVLGFRLLAIGGVMVFDDYTWSMEPHGEQDVLNLPKAAIDSFVNTHLRKLTFSAFGAGHAQYAVRKTAA